MTDVLVDTNGVVHAIAWRYADNLTSDMIQVDLACDLLRAKWCRRHEIQTGEPTCMACIAQGDYP